MSTTPFAHKRPGDPPRIPAMVWNQLVDMLPAKRHDMRGGPQHVGWSGETVLVRNSTGEDVGQFGIMGISAPLISPTANEDEFTSRVMFDGILPATVGLFVVTVEPIPDGEIGRAVVHGVVPVRVTGDAEPFADITSGDTTVLTMIGSGSACVLWAESGSTERWAVVRLGDSPLAFSGVAVTNQIAFPSPAATSGTCANLVEFTAGSGLTGIDTDDYNQTDHLVIPEEGVYLIMFNGGAGTATIGAGQTSMVWTIDIRDSGGALLQQYPVAAITDSTLVSGLGMFLWRFDAGDKVEISFTSTIATQHLSSTVHIYLNRMAARMATPSTAGSFVTDFGVF